MEKLPLDITSIILSRLPFRSVGQGRCVSKLWCSILSDSQFPITQLTQNSKIPSDLIVFYHDPNQRVPNIFYVEANENGELPIKPFKTFDSEFIRKFYSLPYILGACHGFICISQTNFFNISLLPCNPIYVLNTVTGEHSAFPHFKLPKREVPDWIEEGKKTDKCLSGFGFDESIKKFKFVLVVFGAQDYNAQIFRNNVQVHTLGSTNWRRKVGIVPNELHKSHSKVSFTFVSGFLHWVTIDESSEKEAPLIVTFNLSAEVFGYVPTPESNQLKYPFHCYDVAVLGANKENGESIGKLKLQD
ncbi:F-box domain [Thalictrum thalictroides]|uniref:F-box domain n=1 Tax=Thalictrum thalictroides TaxID=46969 RepID=A0A7J6WQL9_THATH|nr:F-box domain [Thalictrum thalictroides]